jgi:hypothetical protein
LLSARFHFAGSASLTWITTRFFGAAVDCARTCGAAIHAAMAMMAIR